MTTSCPHSTKRFAFSSQQLINAIFPYYQKNILPGRTSYRPIEVAKRKSSYRKDDTRLHVDSFPATPNHGHRLLRVFSNINPYNQARVWRIGESFEEVARTFLPLIGKPLPGSAQCLNLLRLTKSLRSEYDHIMLQIHNRMKKDLDYQRNAKQIEISFPTGSSWIVQTDSVPHAAMSGQFLLEQTFYIPVAAMRDSNQSPLRILERLTGRKLVN